MDTQSLLESFGYLAIFISIFIESGFLLGLFLPLPSFSLLFAAGVFAASDKMSLLAVILVGSAAAIAGYTAGYFTGYSYGRRLFYEKATTKYFTREQGLAVERFMKRYGYLTLLFGRYFPIVHNAAPLLSGVAKSPLFPFMVVNVVGGMLWVISSVLLGFYIGQSAPNAQYYLVPFVLLLIITVNSPLGKRFAMKFLGRIEKL